MSIVDISEEALSHNILQIRSMLPENANLFFVLKANAYGHGIQPVIKQLVRHKCQRVAAETATAAASIRAAGFEGEILLLHPISDDSDVCSCLDNDIALTVNRIEQLTILEEECRRRDSFCRIHLKLDVGLRRIGSSERALVQIATTANNMSRLTVEGLYAHPKSPSRSREEYNQVETLFNTLIRNGIPLKCMHYANSSVLLRHPDIARNGLRIGILLYGVLPCGIGPHDLSAMNFKPAMCVKTNIIQIHEVARGDILGYYSETALKKDSRIAVIPAGYAHGLNRDSVVSQCNVLVAGALAPLCGDVFMNTSYVDISDIPNAQIGDEVVVLGQQGDKEITITDIAQQMNTIPAEIMMRMGNACGY